MTPFYEPKLPFKFVFYAKYGWNEYLGTFISICINPAIELLRQLFSCSRILSLSAEVLKHPYLFI